MPKEKTPRKEGLRKEAPPFMLFAPIIIESAVSSDEIDRAIYGWYNHINRSTLVEVDQYVYNKSF